jgi:hypothetical protein
MDVIIMTANWKGRDRNENEEVKKEEIFYDSIPVAENLINVLKKIVI